VVVGEGAAAGVVANCGGLGVGFGWRVVWAQGRLLLWCLGVGEGPWARNVSSTMRLRGCWNGRQHHGSRLDHPRNAYGSKETAVGVGFRASMHAQRNQGVRRTTRLMQSRQLGRQIFCLDRTLFNACMPYATPLVQDPI